MAPKKKPLHPENDPGALTEMALHPEKEPGHPEKEPGHPEKEPGSTERALHPENDPGALTERALHPEKEGQPLSSCRRARRALRPRSQRRQQLVDPEHRRVTVSRASWGR